MSNTNKRSETPEFRSTYFKAVDYNFDQEKHDVMQNILLQKFANKSFTDIIKLCNFELEIAHSILTSGNDVPQNEIIKNLVKISTEHKICNFTDIEALERIMIFSRETRSVIINRTAAHMVISLKEMLRLIAKYGTSADKASAFSVLNSREQFIEYINKESKKYTNKFFAEIDDTEGNIKLSGYSGRRNDIKIKIHSCDIKTCSINGSQFTKVSQFQKSYANSSFINKQFKENDKYYPEQLDIAAKMRYSKSGDKIKFHKAPTVNSNRKSELDDNLDQLKDYYPQSENYDLNLTVIHNNPIMKLVNSINQRWNHGKNHEITIKNCEETINLNIS